MGDVSASVKRWLVHIQALAGDIGFRLPTSEGEARALDYCRRTLAGFGLTPRVDDFVSASSVFRPHIPAAAAFLIAFALYPLARPGTAWAAAVLVWFAVYCEIMEITLRPNPFHALLPKRPSRNVFAVVGPAGDSRRADPAGRQGGAGSAGDVGAGAAASAGGTGRPRDIVLIGHVDTQRTPVIFSSAGWMAAYRAFSTFAFAAFLAQGVLYTGGAALGWPWAWPVSGVSAVAAVLLLALCLEAGASPSTRGANDNATAAGLVLTLAGEFAARPLGSSRLWLLCSGCEESLHEGAKTFFAAHRPEMNEPRAVALEMLGCGGPAWVVKEGFVLPLYSDPGLRALAESVSRENPDLGAYPGYLTGGVSEMSDAVQAGVPAITVIGVTPAGEAPHWHRPSDTVDKMDAGPGGAMERNYRFVRALLEAMDAG